MNTEDFRTIGKDTSSVSIFTDSMFPRRHIGFDTSLRYSLLNRLHTALFLLAPSKIFIPVISNSIIQVLPVIDDFDCEKVVLLPNISFNHSYTNDEKEWLSQFIKKNRVKFFGSKTEMKKVPKQLKKLYEFVDSESDTNILLRKDGKSEGEKLHDKLMKQSGILLEVLY